MVSEIEFWGKKVGDQCIFTFITHAKSLKTTSVILPAKVKRISNVQTQFLQVTLRLVSWRQETVPQVTC